MCAPCQEASHRTAGVRARLEPEELASALALQGGKREKEEKKKYSQEVPVGSAGIIFFKRTQISKAWL